MRSYTVASRRLRIERLESRDLLSASYFPPSFFVVGAEAAPSASPMPSPRELGLSYLARHAGDFNLNRSDLLNPTITSQYTDADSGTTYLYARQSVAGLNVEHADMSIAVTASGRVISIGGGFVPGLAGRLAGASIVPQSSPADAVRSAALALSLPVGHVPVITSNPIGNDQASMVSAPAISLDEIPTRLQWVPTADGSAVLAWRMVLRTPDGNHWYDVSIADGSHAVVALHDWTNDASYNVVPLPNESPQDGGFSVLSNPHDVTASPFGWHDTNGVAGAEFTDTRGNNVDAHLDRNNDNAADASPPRTSGGATLDFSGYTFDPAQSPLVLQNQDAAMVNLFYVNNLLHDVHYKYGFTEVAGNFQVNNYGKGGLANDAVQADAQDGGGTNNANMSTPADGASPRMQMYLFTTATPNRDGDFDNGIVIHEYGHGVSNRLTGGPANPNALSALQSGGMGEGWSDWYALMLQQRPADAKNDAVSIGTYALNQPQTGAGIRRRPYSYDLTVDPLDFDAFGTTGSSAAGIVRSTEVHDAGELWCSALWDLNWQLIAKYGYDSNLATGYTAGPGPAGAGNKLALKLIMDGMKLQPALPSFIQARDAILAADMALNGGADLLEIWTAFARRGLGELAVTSGSSASTITVDYTIPAGVLGLAVTGSTPALNAVVTIHPASYTLITSGAVDPATLQAADLAVNGKAATGFAYTPGTTTISFTFATDPVTAEGLQTMSVTAGAFNQLSDGKPVFAYNAAFRYDTLPMAVTSTSPVVGSTVAIPLVTLDVNLNEPVDPASVGASDLGVSQGSVTAVSFLNANQTIRFTLNGTTTEGTLNVSIAAGALADGNGNPNLAFSASYELDVGTRAFSVLAPVAPLGSTVYRGSVTGIVNTAVDVDDFTLSLNAGQILTLFVGFGTTLRSRITVLSPTLAVLADMSASTAGGAINVPPIAIATDGLYTIRMQGVAGTSGAYSVQATLNAAIEAESIAGNPTNNTSATAQSLTPAILTTTTPLGTSTRANVSGTFDKVGNYTAVAATFAFEDIAATGATILATLDDEFAAIPLPFTFNFYGVGYSSLFANTNGLLTFESGTNAYINGDLSGSPTSPAIAVFWDDLFTSADGVKWEVRGTANSRRLIVQWANTRFYDGTATTLNFQAVLFEGSNQIRFNYSNLAASTTGHDNGASASVGVKDGTGATRLVLANNNGPNTFVGNSKSTVLTPAALVDDYYSFAATAGQVVTLGLNSLVPGTPELKLFATNGTTLLASAVAGPTNFSKSIVNFAIPTTGTYFVAASGSANGGYGVSVLTNSVLDAEPNNSASVAQPLGAARAAYGYVLGGSTSTSYDFESGLAGWTIDNKVAGTGLWALSTRRGAESGHSAKTSFYYGQEIAGNYDNGATNAGSITTPTFVVGATDVLSFNYVLFTESSNSFDTASVDITTDGGTTWTTLINRASATPLANTAAWAPVNLNLSAYAGQSAKVRFLFNTVDNIDNLFEGWYVDDVAIGGVANEDWYSITVPAGQNAIRLESRTPSDGAGQFTNTLDPDLRLYNSAGTTLLGSGIALADGRNESLAVNGLTGGSTYLVRVTGGGTTAGEYVLSAATLDISAVPPPRVSGVSVNGGAAQRSRVTTVAVTFDQHVTISSPANAAFELKRQSDAALPTLAASVDDSGATTVVTLTFAGTTAVDFASLADGVYTLTALASAITSPGGLLDGDGNATAGDNYLLVGSTSAAPKLFRYFGDSDGDGDVDNSDFTVFRSAFGTGDSIFNADGDGDTDIADFTAFRSHFGTTLP